MKLYATTTSERAKKGQGGNQYINVEFFVGEAKHPLFIGKVKLYIDGIDNNYHLDFYKAWEDGKGGAGIVELLKVPQKGNKQKTAICIMAGCHNPADRDGQYCWNH